MVNGEWLLTDEQFLFFPLIHLDVYVNDEFPHRSRISLHVRMYAYLGVEGSVNELLHLSRTCIYVVYLESFLF